MSIANLLFSDRRRGAKLGMACGLLVMGFAGSRLAGPALHPSVEACQMHPEWFHNREVWVPRAQVVRVATDHFEIDTWKTRAVVEGPPGDLKAGDEIILVATFDRRNLLRLDATGRWRRPAQPEWGLLGWPVRRWGAYRLMMAVSALVLLWLFARFARLFRGRLAVPAFVARNGADRM